MFLLLAATAFGWSCPAPPPPPPPGKSRLFQLIGTNADGTSEQASHIIGVPGWVARLACPRDADAMRRRALEALHADDRAWLETYVAGTRRPREIDAVEACIAERGVARVRETFGPDDAALGRWLAAEAIRAGRPGEAVPWFEAVDLDRAATVSRFVAGDSNALLALGDTDALLEGGDIPFLTGWLAGHPRHARARSASWSLWLARELLRTADDEVARAEGLHGVGKAFFDFADAVNTWPEDDPSAISCGRNQCEFQIAQLGRDILEGTLARATRLGAWNVWVERAKVLLAERWLFDPSRRPMPRRESRARPPGWGLPLAGPEVR